VAVVQVENAYVAAAIVAEVAAGRPASALQITGITGTNGKTTCAYLLRDILRRSGRATGMIGTVQYEIGREIRKADRTTPTPFDFQQMLNEMVTAGIEHVVMEVSSHALDQRRPGTTRFRGGLFTNLTGDHCDYHLTMENYFAAKAVLFEEYLMANAPAVINTDDPYGRRLLKSLAASYWSVCPVAFGMDESADYRIAECTSTLSGTTLVLQAGAQRLELVSPTIGKFNVYNIAGTAALALELGISADVIRAAVAEFYGAPGRLEGIKSANGIQVFVDYAHTDDALHNVLLTLRELRPRQLAVVFGCGGDRDRTKRPRMGKIAAAMADRAYVTSDNPRTEDPDAIIAEICAGIDRAVEFQTIPDRREAIHHAIADAEPGDIVLVAGKGHEDYQEINGECFPFDDAEQVRSIMTELEIL
jgi:UDP-N-acetylmuramoyl-L-alanyl-D-glutamate--2,6-diaminopimelate ligase